MPTDVNLPVYHEPARQLPVVSQCDVCVCGGGPAGVAAAIASARAGAKTVLLEVQGCLGGVWTAGLLSWIIDAANKPGIMAEITSALESRGARAPAPRTDNYAYDPEAMKLLLEEMCADDGVEICLHTRVMAAARDAANRLAVVVTESKSGRQAWASRVFVDATGDGDLAAQAGCGFNLGRPESGQCQPMSLVALVAGIRADEVAEFIGGGGHEPKERLLAEMRRAGVSPSYGGPTLFRIRNDLFALMANHEYGVSALDAAQITRATLRARTEVHGLVAGLRALGGRWQHLRIVATGAQIGVREARRIHGRYTVGVDDVVGGGATGTPCAA